MLCLKTKKNKKKEVVNMKMKFVVPKVKETFGKLTFAGDYEEIRERVNGRTQVIGRKYQLYSTRQTADNVDVIIPISVGLKTFEYEQEVTLIKPKISVRGESINGNGHTDYVMNADNLVAVK